MELTPDLPVLVLSEDRSRQRLQTSTVSKDLLHANTRKRAAGELTGPVYRYNPSETCATQQGLPTWLLWVSGLTGRTGDKPESMEI